MIIAAPLTGKFTKLPNELLNDASLSLDAIAVMGRLLALPSDWRVCLQALRRRWKCGLERLKRIMNELIAAGWVQRQPPRKGADGAYVGGDYVVFNTRQPVQAGLALDSAAEPAPARARPPKAGRPESAGPESGEPESGLRTPNQEQESPKTEIAPPNPPETGGTTSPSKTILEERAGPAVEPHPALGAPRLGRRVERQAAAAVLDPATEARFHALAAAYPNGTLRSREADARAAFAALTPAEQVAAVVRARSYAECLRRKPGHPFALQTWLRQTDFRDLAARLAAPPAPSPAVRPPSIEPPATPPPADPAAEAWAMVERGDWPRGGTVFVAADSPEGAAWTAHYARFGRRPVWVHQNGKGLGWPMPGAWPPVCEAA